MAKVLWTEDEQQFNKNHPGCISGIFHALDYQYWHSNVKKILPLRKHENVIKHNKRNRRYQRISDDQDPFEDLNLLDEKTSHILVDRSNRNTSSTHKMSLKARLKAFVSEDNNNNKEQDQDFVPGPKLQRTYSIHHLETNEWVQPIIFFPESITENPGSPKKHSNGTHPEINDSQDILEILEVDKELFVNTLQDRPQDSDTKPRLIKSGSFPTAYKSGSRNFMPMKLKDKINEFYTTSKAEKRLDTPTTKNSNDDLSGNDILRLRRISSLNESADRYAHLFDFSVGTEATLRPSRSLKLSNVSENLISAQESSFFKRNNPNQESHGTYFARSSSQNERNPVSLPLREDKYAKVNSTQDFKSLNEAVDRSDNFIENKHSVNPESPALCEDSNGLTDEEESRRISQDIAHGLTVEDENHQISQDITHEYCPPAEKVQISEGFEESFEKEPKTINSKRHMKSFRNDDDFTYLKQILKRSGFIKNGFQQTWYSSHQPLDPFVFQEIESQYFHDPERFAEEVNELSHRLLIFDLVDDVLLTMYEKSSTYYPKRLSSFCHIHPAPITGPLVLDEVWKRVSQLLNFKHDVNESLNDIVSRDLGSDDGWMNLQLDSECVGLDLEALILDEMLEEVLFELI